MKKIRVFAIVFACIVGIYAGSLYVHNVKKASSQTMIATGPPVTLTIPAIHVHAKIEAVGLDIYHHMDVPQHTNDVAWYKVGPVPGEGGNAVIDGHVDTQTGAPAVFADLKNVKIGDTISVTEYPSITHTFVITSVEELPTASFPAHRVFEATGGSHLNLITCDGSWNIRAHNYTERLVVFSRLVH